PPLVSNLLAKLRLMKFSIEKEQSFQIAEAGLNYYQWHLIKFPSDFKDGTNNDGPYEHDYEDFTTREIVGKFKLEITPPLVGSTVVTVKSTGWTNDNPNITRTVTAIYGIPSLVKYAFISQYPAWTYASDNIRGLFHSNDGIRFEAQTNSRVQSAKSTYTCSIGECGRTGTMPAIWARGSCGATCYCSIDSNGNIYNSCGGSTSCCPPSMPSWQFPATQVDFSLLTSTLGNMKTLAEADGGKFKLPPSNTGAECSAGCYGYSIVFNSNGTLSIYKVTSLRSEPTGSYYVYGTWTAHSQSTDYSTRFLIPGYENIPLPSNGIIYAEDNVWVEGTVKGRVALAAALLPYTSLANAKSIYIANNIVYSAKDGTDSLGLVAQRDIIYSYYAPNNLEVDAAEVTQYGSTQALSFPHTMVYPDLKNSITTYGAIMSYDSWNWTWSGVDGSSIYTGFAHTNNEFDGNALYAPPPNFPIANSEYQLLKWTPND
ncbi:MAG: hypothetical protein NTV36_02350, partial [Candidatus Staskawiczbacteria bacterium]|nr:hypothetical protein [Candidatus Staskawiczbacteria bacterium]